MTVKDILDKMNSGACHIILVDDKTSEIVLKTIWYDSIPEEQLNRAVVHINVTDYTMTLILA